MMSARKIHKMTRVKDVWKVQRGPEFDAACACALVSDPGRAARLGRGARTLVQRGGPGAGAHLGAVRARLLSQ